MLCTSCSQGASDFLIVRIRLFHFQAYLDHELKSRFCACCPVFSLADSYFEQRVRLTIAKLAQGKPRTVAPFAVMSGRGRLMRRRSQRACVIPFPTPTLSKDIFVIKGNHRSVCVSRVSLWT